MPNSLYNQLNVNNNNINFNNPQNLIQQFNEFRKALQGDPQQIVEQLLQSGRMTQQQYAQLQQMATQFQQLLKQS